MFPYGFKDSVLVAIVVTTVLPPGDEVVTVFEAVVEVVLLDCELQLPDMSGSAPLL